MEDYYHLIYPMRTILISSKSGAKESVMAADWCMPLSFDPPMFGVAIGKKRFTYELVKESKAYAINLVSPEMKGKMLTCGTKSGRTIDKFREAGLKREDGKITVLVGDSPASIECKVVDEVGAGDHVLFVGEVVNAVIRKKDRGIYHFGDMRFAEL